MYVGMLGPQEYKNNEDKYKHISFSERLKMVQNLGNKANLDCLTEAFMMLFSVD